MEWPVTEGLSFSEWQSLPLKIRDKIRRAVLTCKCDICPCLNSNVWKCPKAKEIAREAS